MTVDLWMLAWAVVLAFIQVSIAASGTTLNAGLGIAAGNREGFPQAEGWIGRAVRAHRNMLESLPLFAALVLIAAVAGKANEMTALGAQIFFWARLAYAVVYLIGIPYLRTVVWAVSVVGMLIIFLQLFAAGT